MYCLQIRLCLSVTDAPWLMFPGLSLMATGGLPLLVTNTQVSNLFLVGSSTVVGLLCGAFDTSSAVMLIVKVRECLRNNIFLSWFVVE
ncbi:hypothetical protein DPMN_141353 [Dreissena polymorpha]|uniref:Uncharacterized protein n=1 Tax=Dreissena polymorpha TaxID=45954 RepID=A0A9D4GD99_DREPO|nr:hypothetical protein DPMN_141353 [Dreissena polymorpha]